MTATTKEKSPVGQEQDGRNLKTDTKNITKDIIGDKISIVKGKIFTSEAIKKDIAMIEKLFGSEAKPILLRGSIRIKDKKTNSYRNPEYTEMKQSFSTGWGVKERDSYTITEQEITEHIAKGGWLGLPLPKGYISVDVDNIVNGKYLSEYVLPNLGFDYHEMQTPNGYQFIFKDTGKAKNDSRCLSWGGIMVDYRTEKGMIVLPLGERTEGRIWAKTDCEDISPMPSLFNFLRNAKDELEPETLRLPIEEGEHNSTLVKIAGTLQQFGIEDNEIMDVMEMVAEWYCSSPYGPGWEKPVESALKYPKGEKKNFGSFTDENGKIIPFRLADYLIEKEGIKVYKHNVFYRYLPEKGFYERLGTDQLEFIIRNEKRGTSTHIVNETFKEIKFNKKASVDKMDIGKGLNMLNGVLVGGKLIPHSPDNLFTYQFNVNYRKDAKAKRFLGFLSESLKDPKDAETIKEMMGYFLGDFNLDVAFIMFGNGEDGKTVFFNIIKGLLGSAHSSLTPQAMCYQFGVDVLLDKKFNFYDDIPADKVNKPSLVKTIISGGEITVDVKFEKPLTFNPKAKHLFTCNTLPEGDGTFGWARRVKIIEWTGVEKSKIIKNLDEKILAEEASGIFNIMLEYLERVKHFKSASDFTSTDTQEEIAEHYNHMNDPVSAFIKEGIEIVEDEKVRTLKTDTYYAYKMYCYNNEIHKDKIGSKIKFSRKLKDKGFIDARSNSKDYWVGVNLIVDSEFDQK